MLPACVPSVLDPGVWRLQAGCRLDRRFDVDGDRIVDCVRAVSSRDDVKLWAWPRCTGEPIAFVVDKRSVIPARRDSGELAPQVAVTLPERLRTPAWARAIAAILVGDDRVYCESGCAAPEPALAWISDASTGNHYAPHWQAGEPMLPPVSALVLDRERKRVAISQHRDLRLDLADADLVVLDPIGHFDEVGTCKRYRVWASPSLVAAIDTEAQRYSWVLVRGDGNRTPEGACNAGVVFVPHGFGTDSVGLVSIRPDTGVFRDAVPNAANWRDAVASGVLPLQPTITLPQLEAALVERGARHACEVTGPLWSTTFDETCEYTGREDVTGDGEVDCWTATADGTAATGILSWELALQINCDGEHYSDVLDVNGTFRIADPRTLPRAWVAERLVGKDHMRCLPAFANCQEPDSALRRLLDQYAQRSDGTPAPLRWIAGSPIAADRRVVVVTRPQPGLPVASPPFLIVYNPPPGALEFAARCGNREIWSSPAGAAVVEGRRWAWLYVASEPQHYWDMAAPRAITHARCVDELALLALSDGDLAIADMRTGKTTTLGDAERKLIESLPDPAHAFRDALAGARGP